MLGQLGNPLLCKGHTLLAFEVEGLGYYCYGQDAQIFGNFRNDRRSARTCTTAHTGSDKHHVCAIQGGAQRFAVFIRCVTAYFRVSTGAKAFSDPATNLDSLSYCRLTQCLSIGIYRKEFHTFDALAHHVFDGITTATADADDFNHRVIGQFHRFKHSFSP